MEKKIIINPLNLLIILIIKAYQFFISPFFGFNCRFFPSCSEYSIDAFKNFGVIKGFKMSILRLIRCHPLAKGGYDPVKLASTIKIKKVPIKLIYPFRKKSLYINKKVANSIYKEDSLKKTLHIALFEHESLVSGVTLIQNKEFNNFNSLQIRGMFTLKKKIRKGFGTILLNYVKQNILKKKQILWCNARLDALDFYKKNGFIEFGSSFDIKGIGMHRKMFFIL